MFNLNDIIQNAQGGKAIENLATQFGITPDQAQAAVQAIIPALSTGLLQKLGQPGELGSIISAITDSTHQASFSNPDAAQSDATAQKGGDVINNMFGSSHIANQIAQQVAKTTGLRADLIMQMLPVVASIALGGLAKAAQNQGWLGQLANAATAAEQGAGAGTPAGGAGSGGLLGAIIGALGSLLGGGSSAGGAPASGTAGTQSTLNNLGKMFQPGTLPDEIIKSDLPEEIGKILAAHKASS